MKKRSRQEGFIIPLIIIIIAALAIGGGVYYSNKARKMPQSAAVQSETESNASTSAQASSDTSASSTAGVSASTTVGVQIGKGNGTLRALMTGGKDLTCTFTGTSASSENSGTVYLSGNMMRGDFTMKQTGKAAVDSHMIRNSDDVYVWSGTQGAKMGMDMMESNAAKTNTSTSAKTNVDLDQKVDYTCSPWTKDSSKFTVPTTVKFVDVAAMLKASANVKTGL